MPDSLPVQQVSSTPHFGVVLTSAASGGASPEALHLLIRMGVFPAAQYQHLLLSAIDRKTLEGVAAMASCHNLLPSEATATPDLDVLQLGASCGTKPFAACKRPCPIHRALSLMVRGHHGWC